MADRSDRPAFDAPPPDRELTRLAPLLGTWTSEDHTQDSVAGPGVPVTATETFRMDRVLANAPSQLPPHDA
jgi:hypothetical protein